MRRAHSVTTFLVAVLWSTAARADEAHDRALAEFLEARRAIDAGDCATALPKLQASLRHEPSIGARLSIADCVEQEDPLGAWQQLRDALLLAYLNHDDRYPLIRTRMNDLLPRVPAIRVALSARDAELPGLEVRVDGAPVDRFHVRQGPLAVPSGEHVVEVSAPGHHPARRRITTAAGAVTEVTLALDERRPPPERDPAPPPRAAETTAPAPPGSTRRTLGIGLVAAGAGGVALGTAFGIIALSKQGEIEDACGGDRARCTGSSSDVAPLQSSASTAASLSTASFVVGGALAAAGVALWLTAPRGSTASRVVPVAAAGRAGLALEARW